MPVCRSYLFAHITTDTSTLTLTATHSIMEYHSGQQEQGSVPPDVAPAGATVSTATSPINNGLLSPLSVSSSISSFSSFDSFSATHILRATRKEEDQGQEEEEAEEEKSAAGAPTIPRFLPRRAQKAATSCAVCFLNKTKCDGRFPCAM
jgi:hypothetical protein